MQNSALLYRQRSGQFSEQAQALSKRYERVGWLRLTVFFAAIALAILLFNIHWLLSSVFIMLSMAGFYRLVAWHQEMLANAEHLERLSSINEEELATLEHRYDCFPNGAVYQKADHPYALDLDIFGDYSFFQYCCRATTVIGQERLAAYLAHPAGVSEIKSRQAAVTELTPLLDWRQHFRAYGSKVKDDPRHLQMLHHWLKDKNLVKGNRWLTASLFLAPAWFVTCMILWAFTVPWQVMLLLLLPIAWLLKQTKEQVDHIHLRTTHAGEMLTLYGRLLEHIESREFQSPKLLDLKKPLTANGQSAARHISRLAYIIRQLNVRHNFFAIFFNLAAVWDLQWVYRLEKWKARLHYQLPVWFEALREFEALASFANLWHNNPEWVMPGVNENSSLAAVNLGHPLIHAQKRIGNDFEMPVRSHIKLITGSNMAGKSTFLRTVGLNIVLAQAGAPVCAAKFSTPPLQVFTSMRTLDALHENASSFYAELKRLKVIIEAVQAAQKPESTELPVFFLLDEILKGTNSVDRHTGSEALIRQLIRQRGGGLIATHDLELGSLEAEANGAIENLCMEVEVQNGSLLFDYKLKKGVSQSFNATLLMQQMGIDLKQESSGQLEMKTPANGSAAGVTPG